ncbi:hypothetical protein B9J78_06225 [bacterium Unc6]|nr:hypothetical protein [bacterium Unc6]
MEFDEFFSTEEACRNYLFRVRWPHGFQCRRCKGAKAWINNRHLLVCSECGSQLSLVAGTVMEGTPGSLCECGSKSCGGFAPRRPVAVQRGCNIC